MVETKQITISVKQWCYFNYEVILSDIKRETPESLAEKLLYLNDLLSKYKLLNRNEIEFYFFTPHESDFLGLKKLAFEILHKDVDISKKNKLRFWLTNNQLEPIYRADVIVDYSIDENDEILIYNIDDEDTYNIFEKESVYKYLTDSLTEANLNWYVIEEVNMDPSISLNNIKNQLKEELGLFK